MTRCLSVLCLVSVTALVGGREARADEGPPDAVVLVSGVRVPCTVISTGARRVKVRIGARTYDLERASLARVERAGELDLDPEMLSFVRVLAARVDHANARIAAAAGAALRALGGDGRPYLEAVASESEVPARREALLALARNPDAGAAPAGGTANGGMAAFVDARVASAKKALSLDEEQTKTFRAAFETMLTALRGGTAWQESWTRMRKTLEAVLKAEQMQALDGWARSAFQRPGGGG